MLVLTFELDVVETVGLTTYFDIKIAESVTIEDAIVSGKNPNCSNMLLISVDHIWNAYETNEKLYVQIDKHDMEIVSVIPQLWEESEEDQDEEPSNHDTVELCWHELLTYDDHMANLPTMEISLSSSEDG